MNKTESASSPKYGDLSKSLGNIGIVLGILTLLISMIPLFGMFAVFIGNIALLISLIGIVIAYKHKHPKSRLLTALMLTAIGMGICFLQFLALR
ncbi:MAG: hypothetical protein AAF960_22550 [Bacteroidota bacterium]